MELCFVRRVFFFFLEIPRQIMLEDVVKKGSFFHFQSPPGDSDTRTKGE